MKARVRGLAFAARPLLALGVLYTCIFSGCADLFDDAKQCQNDLDCVRFGGVCDIAQSLCVASGALGDGGTSSGTSGGGDSSTNTESDSSISTTDAPVAPNCNATPKTTVAIGTKIDAGARSEITGTVTLECDKDWVLDTLTLVRSGATLNVGAGTTIRAKKGVGAGLIVSPGGKIVANGTAAQPIVITSDGNPPAAADWRGIYIVGKAPPAGRAPYENDPDLAWGGTAADDNSGVLSFVRIEYARAGLVFAGVGNKTKVDSVEVRRTDENCFFFNGGTVDVKHLVCQAPADDMFEWGEGYAGRAQFVFGHESPVANFDGHGLLIDAAKPVIYNATICGESPTPQNGYGLLFRNGATIDLNNLIVAGWGGGFDATGNVGVGGNLRASVFFGNTTNPAFAEDPDEADPDLPTFNDDNDFDELDFFAKGAPANVTTDPKLAACFDAKAPKPYPQASLTAGAKAPPADGFFDATSYIGAFKDANDKWMTGAWVRFDDK